MSILNVENVTHYFGGRKILEEVTFRLLQGEHVGLIGANGEGKSTFLNIITGDLMPDSGKVSWCNKVTIGYIDQRTTLSRGKTIREVLHEAFKDLYEKEAKMLELYNEMAIAEDDETMNKMLDKATRLSEELEAEDFYMIDSRVEEIAFGLGLGDIGLDREVDQLSGGQRTKVLLTKVLLKNPMILILDEPTNFLDQEHIEWLTGFLKNYKNAFILVSHDIPFLNNVINVIYHVENGELTRYTANYEKFQEMYELKKRQNAQAYEKQQKEIDRLETFIAKNKARASTASLERSKQKRLDKIDVIEVGREKIKPIFDFKEARTPGREIIVAKDLIIGYDEPLTSPLNITLERGQKVAIKGVNGLGKSTLMKTLLKIIPPVAGEVEHDQFLYPGYFEQEEVGNNNTALEEILQEFPHLQNNEARGALAKCGLSRDHVESLVRVLSGGENAKVRLCKVINNSSNLLILDEPTNHLDVDAKDELKRALKAYKGTILLVSHEPEFYEDWVSDIWNVEEWTTKIV